MRDYRIVLSQPLSVVKDIQGTCRVGCWGFGERLASERGPIGALFPRSAQISHQLVRVHCRTTTGVPFEVEMGEPIRGIPG